MCRDAEPSTILGALADMLWTIIICYGVGYWSCRLFLWVCHITN